MSYRILMLVPEGLTLDALSSEQQAAIASVLGQYVLPMIGTIPNAGMVVLDGVAAVIIADTTTAAQYPLANAGSGGAATRYYCGNQNFDFGNTAANRAVPVIGALGMIGRHGNTGSTRQRANFDGDTQVTNTLTRANPTAVNSRLFANGNDTVGFFDGGIGDMIVFTKEITPAEADYIAGLMTSRWGVTMAPVLY